MEAIPVAGKCSSNRLCGAYRARMLFVAGARMKHLLAIVTIGLTMCPIVW